MYNSQYLSVFPRRNGHQCRSSKNIHPFPHNDLINTESGVIQPPLSKGNTIIPYLYGGISIQRNLLNLSIPNLWIHPKIFFIRITGSLSTDLILYNTCSVFFFSNIKFTAKTTALAHIETTSEISIHIKKFVGAIEIKV